ncbi:hypothetical protein E5P65_00365 [Helicobacter pylori]|nr:hypothetical protein E5P65_00365 [Helicobacter pylori]
MNIIIDNSGSMNENGKKEALQLWLLAFEQLAKNKNIDMQKWDLKGLKGEFEDALLLSDGHFTEEIQVKSSVAFGIDANMIKLKEISLKVFDSTEIFQILQFMIKSE